MGGAGDDNHLVEEKSSSLIEKKPNNNGVIGFRDEFIINTTNEQTKQTELN